VLVAGAGLAGLSAARSLEQQGARVTVVEARERIGGRVWTIRDGPLGGQHAELGADIIEPEQQPVLDLARTLNIQLVHVLEGGFGFFGPTSDGRLARQSLERTFRVLERDVAPLIDAYRLSESRWDTAVARELGKVSLAAWLKARHVSEVVRERVRALRGLFLADPEDLSLLAFVDFVATDPFAGGSHVFRVRGGNDLLTTRLAGLLRAEPQTRTILRSVRQSPRGVTLSLETNGRIASWSGDYLVCAMPSSTLAEIQFDPALPPAQQRAIRTLRYGPATRVLLQFDRAFWRRRGHRRAFGTNQEYGAVWDANEEQRGPAGILSVLAGGKASHETHRLLARSGVGGLAQRMSWLGRPSSVTWAHVYRWEEDPWARGGYAYFDPGFDPADRHALSQSAGRVCFAGEHTSFEWQGYMSGAIVSGQRAVAEIALMHTGAR
jgi:monoamine oxidase